MREFKYIDFKTMVGDKLDFPAINQKHSVSLFSDSYFDYYSDIMSEYSNSKRISKINNDAQQVLKDVTIPEFILPFTSESFTLKNNNHFLLIYTNLSVKQCLKKLSRSLSYVEDRLQTVIERKSMEIITALSLQENIIKELNYIKASISSIKTNRNETEFTQSYCYLKLLDAIIYYNLIKNIISRANLLRQLIQSRESVIQSLKSNLFLDVLCTISTSSSIEEKITDLKPVRLIMNDLETLKLSLLRNCTATVGAHFSKYCTMKAFETQSKNILFENKEVHNAAFCLILADPISILNIFRQKIVLLSENLINELLLKKMNQSSSQKNAEDVFNPSEELGWGNIYRESFKILYTLFMKYSRYISMLEYCYQQYKSLSTIESTYYRELEQNQHFFKGDVLTEVTYEIFIKILTRFTSVVSSSNNISESLSFQDLIESYICENKLIQAYKNTFKKSLLYDSPIFLLLKTEFNKKHITEIQTLLMIIKEETFSVCVVPTIIQQMATSIITASTNSSFNIDIPFNNKETNDDLPLILESRKYLILFSFTHMIKYIHNYLCLSSQIPSLSPCIFEYFVDMSRLYTKKLNEILLHLISAEESVNMTYKKISIFIRTIECFLTIFPYLIKYFEIRKYKDFETFPTIYEPIKNSFEKQVELCIQFIANDVTSELNNFLLKWPEESSLPSLSIIRMSRYLEQLDQTLTPLMIGHNVTCVFRRVVSNLKNDLLEIIKSKISRVNMKNDKFMTFIEHDVKYLVERLKTILHITDIDDLELEILSNIHDFN